MFCLSKFTYNLFLNIYKLIVICCKYAQPETKYLYYYTGRLSAKTYEVKLI